MKKFLSALGISLVLVGCNVPSSSTENETTQSDTIKIGGIAPLSGDAASVGIFIQNTINLRVDEINEEGGIDGRKIEMIWEDGKCAPGDASRATQKLIGMDKVSVILGGVCSGETLGGAPIAEKKKVIWMSPTSTSPEVTKAGDFIFRTAPSDASQGFIFAEYANKKFKKVGILNEQTDYAFALAETFKKHFTGEILQESFLSSESDFKTRITKLKAADLEALFIVVQSPPKFEIIAKQLEEQAWENPVLVNEVIMGNKNTVKNFANFFTKNEAIGANFVAPESEELQEYAKKYEEKFQEKPAYLSYAANTIDAVDILIKAIREVGNETDTEAIRDALYATQDYEGVFGKLSFDENGDVNITHSLFEFDGEEFIPLKE